MEHDYSSRSRVTLTVTVLVPVELFITDRYTVEDVGTSSLNPTMAGVTNLISEPAVVITSVIKLVPLDLLVLVG